MKPIGEFVLDVQWANARGHDMDIWAMRCQKCGERFATIKEWVERGGPTTCPVGGDPRAPTPILSATPRAKRPKLIYVSGPLTTGQLTANVRAALDIGKALIDRGYAVVVPHEKLLTEILHPMSYDEWLNYDFRIILCCDALYRMPGESHGGDEEVKFAQKNGIPVYTSLDLLCAIER